MKYKYILIAFYIFISSGFQLSSVEIWNISKDDPYLWIKICSLDEEPTIKNDFPSSHSLYGQTLTRQLVIESVMSQINSLESTYLKLETHTTGSNYNSVSATDRTIEYCNGDPEMGSASGVARSETNNNGELIGCKITIDDDDHDEAKKLHAIFAHELGHCLGLSHPQEITDAIMSYYRDEDMFDYQIDDLMGITNLYPTSKSDAEENATLGLKCSL